jgi:ribonuclease D
MEKCKLSKNKKSWNAEFFSFSQLEYAASDAWIGYRITEELFSTLGSYFDDIWSYANSFDFSNFNVEDYKVEKIAKEDLTKYDKQHRSEIEWRKQTGFYQKKLQEKKKIVQHKKRKNEEINDLVQNLKKKNLGMESNSSSKSTSDGDTSSISINFFV